MKEYIYKLTLVERLFVADNWTDEDEQTVFEHFEHLKDLLHQNKLILAGKTAGLDNTTYGIVVFQASDWEEANTIMNRDPALQHGIMTAVLHEYNVALHNPNFTKK